MADELAKKGCKLAQPQRLGLPLRELKNQVEAGLREKWDTQWDRYPHARQTKYFYPSQCKEKGKEAMQLTRIKLGRLIKLITGHNNLAYHRSNINPDIDPMCRFCSEAQESFIHLFADCPALWRERRELEGGEYGGAPNYVSPQQVLEFSYIPRINEALENTEEVDNAWQELERMSQGSDSQNERTEDDEDRAEDMDVDDVDAPEEQA